MQQRRFTVAGPTNRVLAHIDPKLLIGPRPIDFQAVINVIAKGDLSIHTTTTNFEGIPEAIERLKNGNVVGRIVAVMD